MLRKDLLRVSRAGGGYQPQFADSGQRRLAARVLGTFQGHLGHPRHELEAALADLETEADHFKLVRGFTALLEREAVFETATPIEPATARRAVFDAAEAVGIVSDADRQEALTQAGTSLGVSATAVAESLYADLEERQHLTSFESPWDPHALVAQYNLSLAQTALFDATEIRVRSSDPKALISSIKRLGLMYEILNTEAGRVVVVTGPTHLFRATRRYGTRFSRLLRTVAKSTEWSLEAAIDDRGTDRTLTLSHEDIRVPDADPVATVSFDSAVERDFATRFEGIDLEWTLVREPEPLSTGSRVMIPDFAFEYNHSNARLFFEIMGFWTPEYVEKKLTQLEHLEDVDLLVAVDRSLGVGEEIASHDHRVIEYTGRVRLKAVRDVLREYETGLVAESAASLPATLEPREDVLSLTALADRHGVSEAAVESKSFPAHERVGRTLVRPAVLTALAEALESGLSLEAAEAQLEAVGLTETSAVLSRLGYRVEWDGLAGGTIRAQ